MPKAPWNQSDPHRWELILGDGSLFALVHDVDNEWHLGGEVGGDWDDLAVFTEPDPERAKILALEHIREWIAGNLAGISRTLAEVESFNEFKASVAKRKQSPKQGPKTRTVWEHIEEDL